MHPPASARDDFQLRFATSGDVLKVAVSGDIDAQHVRIGYWEAIAEEGRRRGLRKLLVTDRRKGVPATPGELAELAQLFRHEAPHFDRVAVIEPVVAFLPMEHAEIFGRAAGINVRIFGDARTAEVRVRHGDCRAQKKAPWLPAGALRSCRGAVRGGAASRWPWRHGTGRSVAGAPRFFAVFIGHPATVPGGRRRFLGTLMPAVETASRGPPEGVRP